MPAVKMHLSTTATKWHKRYIAVNNWNDIILILSKI